jgi:hypothetical protein
LSEDPENEKWEGWDDPLDDLTKYIRAVEPRVIAEEVYRLLLREQVTEWMLAEGLDPRDSESGRSFFADRSQELIATTQKRMLQWCASISSREG